ncbi:MAG: DUF1345 domain-containing protein [Actinomycetaceae bacterium]
MRVNVSLAAGLLGSVAVGVVHFLAGGAEFKRSLGGLGEAFVDSSLVVVLAFWIVFAFTHVALTHSVYSRMTVPELRRHAAREERRRRTWWRSLLGDNSAETWAVQGALLASLHLLTIAQTQRARESGRIRLLGLAAVAGSWALMVYSFAIRYVRLDATGARLGFDLDGEPRFGDYLTMSVLTSTLVGANVRCRTSEAWSALRTHSLLAFVFNTIIVAMTISLLMGGIGR